MKIDCKVIEFPPSGLIIHCYKEDVFNINAEMYWNGRTDIRTDKLDGVSQVKIKKDYDTSVTYERRIDNITKGETDPEVIEMLNEIDKIFNEYGQTFNS